MTKQSQITIEIVYGTPIKQTLLNLQVAADSNVQQAIEASTILSEHPEIDLAVNKVGIWNRSCKLGDSLREGDRIEVYRPLIADPKEMRKKRAQKAKAEGRADKITGGRVKDKKGRDNKPTS